MGYVKDYKIVVAASLEDLERDVREDISNEWKPLGAPFVVTVDGVMAICQAMTYGM